MCRRLLFLLACPILLLAIEASPSADAKKTTPASSADQGVRLADTAAMAELIRSVENATNDDIRKWHPARPETGGLRLELTALLSNMYTSDGSIMEWGGAFLYVDVALRNISQSPITVPTTGYDGNHVDIRKWPGWGEGMERIRINIEPPIFQGTPTAYATSRFAPVTLAPGECVLILHHSASIKERKQYDAVKEVSVSFSVAKRFKGLNDWWNGHLENYQDIARTDDPDRYLERVNTPREQTSDKPLPAK